METLIGIGVALGVAAVAARTIIREALPNGAHKQGGHAPADPAPVAVALPKAPPPVAPAPTPAPAAPDPVPVEQVRETPPILDRHFPPAPRPAPSENGVVVTPFKPFTSPSVPPRPRRPGSVTVDLLPGARIEVVDLEEAPPLWHPRLRPDPDRLIQTEIAIPQGPAARAFALARLTIGVMSFGVLLGVGIVFGVRLIVALFQAIF